MLESLFSDWSGSNWDKVSDFFTGYTSANQQWRFSQAGMALQDQYQRNLMRDAPSIQKEGLLNAGYNPLLAVSHGVSSPSSAVSYSAPQPKGFGLGDVASSLGSAFGFGNDFMRVLNESKVADATVRNLEADVALKSAKTLTEPSVKNSLDVKSRKDAVDTITDVVDSAAPLAGSAAAAYAAKKSAEVAKEGIHNGMTKESARKLAQDLVGAKPSTSAVSSAKLFGDVLSLFLPTAALGVGIGNDIKTSKAMKDKDFKEWSNIRASGYGY